MNAGKSIEVLKIAHNYEEQGKKVLILTSSIDDRHGVGKITSRVGLVREAITIFNNTDIIALVKGALPVNCVLVDEGQFMSEKSVAQLCRVVDQYSIPVIVYGLKTDFQNKLFPGSEALICWADKIEEVKTVCWFCDRKAMVNMRIHDGKPVREGEQIMIGGNESYIPVCRRCYLSPELESKVFDFFLQQDGTPS
jgi:thymidine kinase